MRRLYRFLINTNFFVFCLIFVLSSFAIDYFIMLFPGIDFYVSPEERGIPFMDSSIIAHFLIAVVVGPLIETEFFQALPIELLRHIAKRFKIRYSTWPIIIISAVLFGAIHYFNIAYIIATFLIGILLAFAYHVARKRKQNALATVWFIHGLMNVLPMVQDIMAGRITNFF